MATTTKDFASHLIGMDVAEWVAARRETPAEPSYQTIADELRAATGGQVKVTDQTIRNWYVDVLKTRHGACPNCDQPTWHNGDDCPNAVVEVA